MGKTYCFRVNSDPSKFACMFTLSNDSIRIYDLPRGRRDHMRRLTHHEKPLRRYPGVLVGRLGVNVEFGGMGVGSETLDFIKGWFSSRDNKTGCRFVIVDAVNEPRVVSFYEKNGFYPLFSSEEQEFLYTGGKKGDPVSRSFCTQAAKRETPCLCQHASCISIYLKCAWQTSATNLTSISNRETEMKGTSP